MKIQSNHKDCPRCGAIDSVFPDGPEESFCLMCGFRSYLKIRKITSLKYEIKSEPVVAVA